MAVIVEERATERKATLQRATRKYNIKGAISEGDALGNLLTYLAANQPTIGTVPLSTYECDVDEYAPNLFTGTGVWGAGGPFTIDSFRISFDITGQTTRLTQSRNTKSKYVAPGEMTRDFKGAINVNADGTIDGTEIIVPYLCYQVTYTFNDNAVTTAMVNAWSDIVGTVNRSAFKGYNATELLLTRVAGQKRQDGASWDITFGFAVSRNKTGLVIGDITGIDKPGWYFLWTYYEERVDGTFVHKVPIQANVEQTYEETEFINLQIGT